MTSYIGSELELFATATNWKSYIARLLSPYIARDVLEVGAGIGGNIGYFHNGRVARWLALEPDPAQADAIRARIGAGGLPPDCRVLDGTLGALAPDERFDSILYIDVLEHIADDAAELAAAARHLAPGGHLVVLSPAHRFLFSPFDEAVGHYRRYSLAELTGLAPPGCALVRTRMLDSAGFLASLANRLVLREAEPSRGQIAFWDRVLVPLSRIFDRLTGYRFGKTVVAVWRREDG